MPRELTIEEIHEVVGLFGQAAARAKKAGFDGIEVHAAHGYLLAAFLSPFSNKRNDSYGGSLENRSRILIEVIEAVRKAVGNDYIWSTIPSSSGGNSWFTALGGRGGEATCAASASKSLSASNGSFPVSAW